MLRMLNISKRFPGVVALDDVTLEVRPGEVTCLVGENGAGKSTLMRILTGALPMDSGRITIDDVAVTVDTPLAAREHGIAIVHQDLHLIPALTVAENITLGNEPVKGVFIDARGNRQTAQAALEELGGGIDVDQQVQSLSIAHRQLIAIARAMASSIRFLILDEPTASLMKHETQSLFRVIRKLTSQGVGVIYISHRLEEIFEIADQIAVLRDGKVVKTGKRVDFDRPTIISLMVGRTIEQEYPSFQHPAGDEILRLQNVSGKGFRSVGLTLYRGEVLGWGGLVGAGRSELAHVIFGASPLSSGNLVLDGIPFRPQSPRDAIASGVGLLTEDRNRLGLILDMNVRENITLANLASLFPGPFVNVDMERSVCEEFIGQLHIKTPSTEQAIATLSGGNRQKVVLARWLLTKAKVLIFDEPTTGIDVGARFEIYRIIHELAGKGLGIIIISSDLPELLGVCDRIMVMSEGNITGMLDRNEATQEKIMELASPGAVT